MYRKILVPLDGSKLSECSLEHVKAIARGCQVPEVILLTVVEKDRAIFPEAVSDSPLGEIAGQMQKQANESRQKVEDYLAKIASSLSQEGINVQTIAIMSETVNATVDIILHYAHHKSVDLIVMSTHGRSGISRWAFGSVADRVIRQSNIPVLTITPAGCRLSQLPG